MRLPTVKLASTALVAALLSLSACRDSERTTPPESAARWHNNQGVVYMDQHNYTRARQEFAEALRISPDYALAHANLGIALYSLGRYDSAAVALEKAMTLEDSLLRAHYTMGLIITAQGRDYERALQELETVVAADPDDPHALYYRGQVKAKLGRSQAAIQDFERAIELDPYNVSAHYALANQYRQLGRKEKWRAALNRFNELTGAGYQGVSSSYQGQGVYAEAAVDVGGTGRRPTDAGTPLLFSTPHPLPSMESPPVHATVAAATGGTRADLLTVSRSGSVQVYSAGAAGGLLDSVTSVPAGGLVDVQKVTAADWDDDGDIDLLISGRGVHLLERLEDGWAAPRALTDRGSGAFVGDVDHDGDLELATNVAKGLQLLANDGKGALATRGPALDDAPTASVVRFSDLDNDRDTDILVAGPHGLQVFTNNRDGTFTEIANQLGLPSKVPWVDMTVRDLNRDRYVDLVLLAQDGTLQVMTSTEGHYFDSVQSLRVPLEEARGLVAVDLDFDGDYDMAVFGAGGLWVLQNHGATLELPDGPLLSEPVDWVQALDWDGDGRTDLIADGRVLRNQTQTGNWMRVVLRGQGSNTSGLGAKVEVKTANQLLKQEVHHVSPLTFGVGTADSVEFVRVLWPSGVRQTELASPANRTLVISELDRKGTSCPIVYAWDGERFRFVSDINGGAIVGYLIGPEEYYQSDTDEYLPLGPIVPLDGHYTLQFANHLEEVIYADALELIAVDHPADVQVFPNERLLSAPPYPPFKLYPLESLRPARRVVDDQGHDVTSQLTAVDNNWYHGFALTDIHGYAREFALELDLGDLSTMPAPVLLAHGWVDYAHSTSNWAAAQRNWTLFPPLLEVPDGAGGWRTVCADMGTPAGLPKYMLLDLADLLPSGENRIRIRTNTAVYWDQFLIGNRRDTDLHVQRLAPSSADLHWRGYPEHTAIHGTFAFRYHYDRLHTEASWSTHGGRYTRFGPVDELLERVDDQYVIMFKGDEITLRFRADALQPPAPGLERSFLLFSDGFGKDMDMHSAHSLTVEPLPFHDMSTYPYGPEESYPLTEATVDYLSRYNTRVVRGYY